MLPVIELIVMKYLRSFSQPLFIS